jgi:hypothetical protein
MKGRFGLSHWYNESIRTVLRNARQRSGLPKVNRYCPRPLEGRGHVTLARGDSNTLRVHRAPLNSGFSRKTREKRLEFQVGLYCNSRFFDCESHLLAKGRKLYYTSYSRTFCFMSPCIGSVYFGSTWLVTDYL